MRIFRVCTKTKPHEETERDGPVPGWRNSLTGFWTSSLEDARNIWNARNDWMIQAHGGGTWAKIHMTEIDNVITVDDFEEHKEGDDNKFDGHELFVEEIINEKNVKTINENCSDINHL